MKYNANDRIRILNKINAMLAIANCKTAPQSERESALEMANKMAQKHGLKVQQGPVKAASTVDFNFNDFVKSWNNVASRWFCFSPKQAYTKVLKAMFRMMRKAGFDCTLVKDGRKITGITYKSCNSLNKEFADMYREICKNCDLYKKQMKANVHNWSNGNELTDKWYFIIDDVCYEMDYTQFSELERNVFSFATYMIDQMRKMKEGK